MSEPLPAAGESRIELVEGPAGPIETQLGAPRQPRAGGGCAVIAHPHPLYGGAMSNKVVYTLAACAQKAGLYALRFNFRGVGRSAGRHDEGRGETEDFVFLAARLHERLGGPLVLMGFSFGAWISVNAAARLAPQAQLSVAPPFAKYFDHLPRPARPPCPWLVVHGRDDEVVDYEATRVALASYTPPPELVTVELSGHFFHGRLAELGGAVQPFLARVLG